MTARTADGRLHDQDASFALTSLLAAAWAAGEFKEVQARLVKRFENMRNFLAVEPDVELLRWRAEYHRAIEEGDLAELGRLNEELRRRLEERESS
jgi:hypothetical protein